MVGWGQTKIKDHLRLAEGRVLADLDTFPAGWLGGWVVGATKIKDHLWPAKADLDTFPAGWVGEWVVGWEVVGSDQDQRPSLPS